MTKTDDSSIPAQWTWHFRTLSRLREALLRHRNERSAAFRAPVDESGVDTAEAATEETEHDMLLNELHVDEAELAEVEAALNRIRTGTYGICLETGLPIAKERLRAIPWTRYSQEVAARHEKADTSRAANKTQISGDRH